LYNRELAGALAGVLHRPLDILVFDECGMGMIETAHAVRKVARIMIASEELIPGRGTRMDYWLNPLIHCPGLGPSSVAALIVHTYQATIICSPSYTMSAYDTTDIGTLSKAVSGLASAMLDELPKHANEILDARRKSLEYGAEFEPGRIDLERFCSNIVLTSTSWRLRWRALQVIWWSRALRVANGPSIFSSLRFGSNGLAIYFPLDGQRYCTDGSTECGYEHCNTHEPVEFVHDTAWSDFLHGYFAVVWSEKDGPDPQHPHALPATCEDLTKCAQGNSFETSASGCSH
ncbi:MAG: clostripain-related cysteine peptidase, partial [Thermoanaerobaculia bacterium]